MGVELWVSVGACGASSEVFDHAVEVNSCGYSSRMVAYPNRSSRELKVGYVSSRSTNAHPKKEPLNPFSVKLLDQKGKILKEAHQNLMIRNWYFKWAIFPMGFIISTYMKVKR